MKLKYKLKKWIAVKSRYRLYMCICVNPNGKLMDICDKCNRVI